MDGVSDAGLRMQQIAAQLAALRSGGPPATPAATTAAATAAAGLGSGSTSGAGTGSGPASFGSVLADAVATRNADAAAGSSGTGAPATGSPGTTGTAGSFAAARTTLTALTSLTSLTSRTSSVTPAPTAAPSTAPASTAAVSTDLSRYENGRLPAAVLKPVGTGDHRLWAPAADRFQAMAAAAARDGVRLGVNDSYRSYAEQVDMARRKGLYSQGGLAARPGTSDHGWGKSVDLSLDGRALTWMRAHASEYGFHANVARESWHWTYKP